MLGAVGWRASNMFVRHIYRWGQGVGGLCVPMVANTKCVWEGERVPVCVGVEHQ